jgi:RNA polymerase sigma-70 factor (ECF subfamily)
MTGIIDTSALEATGEACDRDRLERARRGDGDALEQVVRACAGRLHATARRLLGNDDDSQDVVQEALLQAVRHLDGFRGEAQLSSWLHRIVVNAALMKLRSRRRRPTVSIDDLLPRFAEDGHRVVERRPWQAPVESLAGRAEVRQQVTRAMDQLPDDYRTILVLRDIEGLSTECAARAVGISPGAVKTRLHRARMALRELLEQALGAAV